MNILVIGGAGFVGSRLANQLHIGDEHRICVYDNLSTGSRYNLSETIAFTHGDILDTHKLKSCLNGIDAVFHLAAKVSVRNSMTEFYEDAQTNIMGTFSLLQALKNTSVKHVLFSSSMAVYDEGRKGIAMTEDYPTNPRSFYGISKLTSEKAILLYAKQFGLKATILRYFNIYGPGQAYSPYVGVVTIFIERMLAGLQPIIYGDGKQVRDFISVGDVVEASILALNVVDSSKERIFNIASGHGLTVNTIAQAIATRLNFDLKSRYEPERQGELRYSLACIDRAKTDLGFSPYGTLDLSLDRIIDAIKKRNY